MTLRAYAKINIGLHVTGKRPDQFHSLETIFHQIDLYDEIEMIHQDEDIHFSTNRTDLPLDRSNLCMRAAQLLQDVTGTGQGARIALKKSIPIGAGLGGGSADAAAVLKGLVKLWSLDISLDELEKLGAGLGSDVPFFIRGGTAYATGRGEILERIPLSLPYHIVVVTPPIHISTAWAYRNITLAAGQTRNNLKTLLQELTSEGSNAISRFQNDFEEIVFAVYPDIKAIKETLINYGSCLALLSGSGASVFGLFREQELPEGLQSVFPPTYHWSVTKPFFTPSQE